MKLPSFKNNQSTYIQRSEIRARKSASVVMFCITAVSQNNVVPNQFEKLVVNITRICISVLALLYFYLYRLKGDNFFKLFN